jgi:peptidoglycan/LPS O-acetylase OafA/YrhL
MASSLMAQNFEVFRRYLNHDRDAWHFISNCWSLGVEEQFYLIMPFITAVLIEFKSKTLGFVFILIILLTSFAINIVLG